MADVTTADILRRFAPTPDVSLPPMTGGDDERVLGKALRNADIQTGDDGALHITIRPANARPRARVGAGDYGLPYMPALERPPAELRTANEPVSDWIAQRTDPMMGHHVQQFLNVGKELEATPYLGPVVRIGEELTGAPAITRGTHNIIRGVEEGSPVRIVGGVAEAGLGAVPAAAGVRALRPALSSTKGIVTTAGTAGLATALPGIAEAQEFKTPKQKELDTLEAQQKELQGKIDKIMGTPAGKAPTYSRRLTPEQLKVQRDADIAAQETTLKGQAKPYTDALAKLETQIEGARTRVREEQQGDLPFRQRHPDITQAMMGTAATLAALGPFTAQLANARGTSHALRDIKVARAAGNEAEVTRLQDELKHRVDPWTKVKYAGAGTAAGGLEYTMLSALPEEIDAQVGTPKARADASAQLKDPAYWFQRGGLGTLMGVGGTGLGFTGAKIGWPQNTATARSQIAQPYTAPSRTQVPVLPNGTRPSGTTTLGPGAWPPEARQAAREYLAQRVGDLDQVTTGDVVAAMAKRGIIPNDRAVGNRLQATQDYLDRLKPARIRGEDVLNAPKTSGGQRLLAVGAPAAALALPGTVSDSAPPELPPASQEQPRISAPGPSSGTRGPQSEEPQGAAQSSSVSLPRQQSSVPPANVPKGHTWDETVGRLRNARGEFAPTPKQSRPSNKADKPEQSVNTPKSNGRQSLMADILKGMD